jgi:uncharacterized membrane protein YfcA
MPDSTLLLSAALFLLVGALFASVGHAGSSGYVALMALLGVQASAIRPAALLLNVLVASIAFIQFRRAGHLRWRLAAPFCGGSMPAAFLGGRSALPPAAFNMTIGGLLLFAAARMAVTRNRTGCVRPRGDPPVPLAVLAGCAIGLVAGLTGTGGGVFLGPLILFLGWGTPWQTAAASAAFSLANSAAGIIGLAGRDWNPPPTLPVWAIAAAAGGYLGATIGSRLAGRRALQVLLSVVLAAAGAKLVLA